MTDIKLFGKWDTAGITVSDAGLIKYISLKPVLVPRSEGRNSTTKFWKNKSSIVERLINKLQIPGHKGKKHKVSSGRCTGKSYKATSIVIKAFEIVERQTKENPLKIFVKAVENAAPREEITTIEYGGAKYPQAVDSAPQRRIDFALTQMSQGAYSKAFDTKKTVAEALADEIISAYKCDNGSQAISKKGEVERQADSSR
jgi:small subunit ribosomal protein S7